jgi:hypothetical protein
MPNTLTINAANLNLEPNYATPQKVWERTLPIPHSKTYMNNECIALATRTALGSVFVWTAQTTHVNQSKASNHGAAKRIHLVTGTANVHIGKLSPAC